MALTRKKPYLPYPDGTGGDSPYLGGDLGLAVPDAPEGGGDRQSPYMQQALAEARGSEGKYGIGMSTLKSAMSATGDRASSPAFEERPELGTVTGEEPASSAPPSSTKPYVEDLAASPGSDEQWQKGSDSFSTTPQNKPYVEGPPLNKTDVPRQNSDPARHASAWDSVRQKDNEIAEASKHVTGFRGALGAGLYPWGHRAYERQVSELRMERADLVRQARYEDERRGREAAAQAAIKRDEERYRHQKATEERASNPPMTDREGREMRWDTGTHRYAPALETRTRQMPVQGPTPEGPPVEGPVPLTRDETVMRGIPGEKPEKPTIIKGPGGAVYERRGDEQPKLLIPGKPDKPEKTKEPKPPKAMSFGEREKLAAAVQQRMDAAAADNQPASKKMIEAEILHEMGYERTPGGRIVQAAPETPLGENEKRDTQGNVWKLKADGSGWEKKAK